MPKLKSHSGAKKRFRITATGKVKYMKAGRRHLLSGMSSKRGRNLRKAGYLAKNSAEGRIIHKMLPYG